MIRALAVVAFVAGIARADDAPDPHAEHHAREANLESIEPRRGVTFSATIGSGLILGDGADDPVGALSLRVGRVATENDVIELELNFGTYFHSLGNERLTDTSSSALIGNQHYLAPALWLRVAAGLNVHTVDNGPMGMTTHVGPAGALGFGFDLLRRHLFVVGLETFSVLAIESGGPVFTGVLGVDVAYY